MALPKPAQICRKCGATFVSEVSGGFCARCLFAPVALPLTRGGGAGQAAEGSDPAGRRGWVGGYELPGRIARGGMGVVYKARDERANRIVALKMVLSGHFAGETERKRFRTEAEGPAAWIIRILFPFTRWERPTGIHSLP